ncbi:DUF488 domain-containing protein [Brachybacterium muris]|uniref:DUF488 domain-containing protein n=1 Tax=Brachybacterium muris TaxID=219301 RepID=UPI00223B02A5|nr:DUF488 domain-containing protein [Brachybacterium muris]MCT1997464.1 DUF488 domain-containing protein [Brachybacterium muris]MCT2260067.1 DUF488 domain-containing protein [Brachybacterium muris]
MPPPLITVGHGRLDRDELTALLSGAGIERLVDVRRFPGSRANDAAARGQVEAICEAAGIDYRWEERLGGRRRLTKEQDSASPDVWWRVAAFRAYAAWTREPEFRAAVADLLVDIDAARTAVMCSESVWWRCHRRIIADVITLEHGIPVEHLMPSGDLRIHEPSEGARLDTEGHVVWDGEEAST